MNRLFITALTVAAAIMPHTVDARILSPEEALQMASTGHPMRIKSTTNTAGMQLAYTVRVQGLDPEAYVFNRYDCPGFLIVAADDSAQCPILGYSDDAVFDPASIPPAMKVWLELCSHSKAHAPAGRHDISPLVKTKWGQEAPYYNLCPMINGRRSATGCAATAMAQVMKVHQWPANGQGAITYSWKDEYTGKTYTESADFSTSTYAWSDMLDSYGYSATSTQKNAVAQLMYDCGASSMMQFSPDGSGTSDAFCARALITYFDYDKAIDYLMRDWYTYEQWDDILYDQLSQGMPVMVGGSDRDNYGHEFVLDGYNTQGYYHVNWGWDGMSDGYFLLSNLDPDDQGIGGGGGNSGFNFTQSAVCNVRKPVAGSVVQERMAVDGDFTTDAKSYTKTSYIRFEGGFYSYSLTPIRVKVGVMLTGDGIEPTFITASNTFSNIDLFEGFSAFQIRGNKFPEGEYIVRPAYQTSNSDVRIMDYPVEKYTGALRMKVTSGSVEISSMAERGELTANYNGWSAINGSDTDLYVGNTYDFTYTLMATGAWSGDLYAVICNANADIVCYSSPLNVSFPQAGSKDFTGRIQIPESTSAGTYYAICCSKGSDGLLHAVSSAIAIKITKAPVPGTVEITSFDFIGSKYKGNTAVLAANLPLVNPTIEVTLKCVTPPYSDNVCLSFADVSTGIVLVSTPKQAVNFDSSGQSVKLTFTGPWTSLEMDTRYGVALFSASAEQLSRAYYVRFEKASQTILWSQTFDDATEGSSISLDATASSGLPVTYALTRGADLATISGSELSLLASGEIEITASQPGNEVYAAAPSVSRTVNVLAGIGAVGVDRMIISVTGRTLCVAGIAQDSTYTVYTTDGRAIYCGNAASVTLPGPGVYLVRCYGKTVKITCR